MRRVVVALLVAVVTIGVLAADALGPFVDSGAPLSASAMRAALDARSEALADVREQVIDVRRTQVALRDRVAALEHSVAASSAGGAGLAPLEATDDVDPWTEAGIVAGRVANAAALNDVFARFVSDVANIREFQGLVLLDQDALVGRIEALEAVAGVLEPPSAGSLAPDDDEVSVPHTFTTGSAMRSDEMNANLAAVDAGLVAEAAMATALAARHVVLEVRIEALEVALGASVREYVVGPGRVATVTSIEGVIQGYEGGAVDATFAGIFGTGTGCPTDDPSCQPTFSPGRPWVPASIDALGRFSVVLPVSPALDGGGSFVLCGHEPLLALNGVVYVHDAPFGEPGSSPTISYVRYRLEDPKEPVGFLADAMILVVYTYTTSTIDLTCNEPAPNGGTGALVLDVDVRLRPGWNAMTWLQRSEGDDMVLYVRTGEPELVVPWVVPEQLY